MDNKPVPLVNFGAKCYLNTCIQAISACSCFVKRIQMIHKENPSLRKLSVFTDLMEVMNGSSQVRDITKNPIFNEWTKSGQQDSYELLAFVINNVYTEIRLDKENKGDIDKGDLEQWLETRLPLRINMDNNVKCKCGTIDKTPLHTDIALHLSFPNTNQKIVNLSQLLEHHFKEENIFDFVCDNKTCKLKDAAWKQLKLCPPSPDSICIHLQRLHWNGRRMSKIDNKVLFCNRLTIKGKYVKETRYGEKAEDVHYYLKSVIVHYGGDSSGHYACYRKTDKCWYYADDAKISDVCREKVFDCNPYILFYERSEYEEISLTVIKLDPWLNIFVHAIISCCSFVDWLQRLATENDILSITLLVYLADVAHGNVTNNETRNREVRYYWCKKRDVYETMLSVMGGVQHMADQAKEKWFKDNVPFGNLVVNTMECQCGYSSSSSAQLHRSIDVSVDISGQNIQALVDKFFQKSLVKSKLCDNKDCNAKEGFNQMRLCHPLSKTICICLQNVHKSKKAIISEELIININHCVNNRRNSVGKAGDSIYKLKSVIPIDGKACFKRIYNDWYHIDDVAVKVVRMSDALSCTPYMMFFELKEGEDRVTETVEYNLGPIITNTPSRTAISNAVKYLPTNIYLQDTLYALVHGLSASSKFIERLNVVGSNRSMTSALCLLRLINLSRGLIVDDGNFDTSVIDKWNDIDLSHAFELMNIIEDDLDKEFKRFSLANELGKPFSTFNVVFDYQISYQSLMTIDISSCQFSEDEKISYQEVLNESVELYTNNASNIAMLLSYGPSAYICFKGPIPSTICFYLSDSYDYIFPSLELIIKNQLCANFGKDCVSYGSCCKKYKLVSIIDINNICYKLYNHQWCKLIGFNTVVVNESDLSIVNIQMLMYD